VRASLRYDPADPYAVHVLFHAESAGGGSRSWSFARELLVTGLDERLVIGDVRVWPWATPRGDFVALALSSPDGNALFEVPRSVLVRFLRRTYVVVPAVGNRSISTSTRRSTGCWPGASADRKGPPARAIGEFEGAIRTDTGRSGRIALFVALIMQPDK